MAQMLQAKDIDLRYLIDNFGLQRTQDQQFFREWRDNLAEITELEKQFLDRIEEAYLNLLDYPPVLENIIRMAILDPLLFMSGFFLYPFHVKLEESVEIVSEDEGTIIKGKIDTLILKNQLWVMVIESKRASFSVEEGLAQMLVYMLSNLQLKRPNYGMITNGGSFLFLKVVKQENPIYATSNLFATRNQGDLYRVFQILKYLVEND